MADEVKQFPGREERGGGAGGPIQFECWLWQLRNPEVRNLGPAGGTRPNRLTCHCLRGRAFTPWFLAGNGGMDPYGSPLRSPIVVPNNPFPHSQEPGSLGSVRGSVVQVLAPPGKRLHDLLRGEGHRAQRHFGPQHLPRHAPGDGFLFFLVVFFWCGGAILDLFR